MITPKEHALYKGEECVAIGTLREIAQITGLTHGHIKSLKLKNKRTFKYDIVELEDD